MLSQGRQGISIASCSLMVTFALACAGDEPLPPPVDMGLVDPCPDVHVERFSELLVVDEAVLGDDRSLNSLEGPWSFRRIVTELTPPGTEPAQHMLDWLNSWRSSQKVNLYTVDARPNLNSQLLCP